MNVQSRRSNKWLAEFCHRLAVETEAGIDIRRTWQREAASAPGALRPSFARVSEAINRGESLSLALAGTGQHFPPLFLEMVHVGEQTGTLERVLTRLSAHFRRQQQLERIFLASIAWPVLELAFAVVVIGVLILIMGMLPTRGGQPIDILGFGLIGVSGLVIYANLVIALTLVFAGVITAMRRGWLWARPLQAAMIRLPGIGKSLEKIALARLAWVLHLTMNVEMDLRRVVPLALRATGNDYYIRHTDQMVADVAAGAPLQVAFERSGAFPADFLDTLGVGEETGQIVESMERLSRRYEEEAEAALKALAVLAGMGVWLLVAGLIVWLIFRLAGFYFGAIGDALKM